jgi:hypothetical protein
LKESALHVEPTPSIGQLARDLHSVFPDDPFVRADALVLEPIQIPEQSKRFLTDVGLPSQPVFGFEFQLIRSLPPIEELVSRAYVSTKERSALRCFGRNFNHVFALDLTRSGTVVWKDLEGRISDMYVNSGVEYFGATIVACAKCSSQRASGYDARQALDDLLKTMAQFDRPAIDGWWSAVLQEFELGLL